MIASRHADPKPTLYLCFAMLAGLVAWLGIVLLSQLALMEPVTAADLQSLADNGDALQFVAAAGPDASYASARLWVWFCIGANGAGAILLGLWLRAAMIAPVAPARRVPAAPARQESLIERAMHGRGAPGLHCASGPRGAPASGLTRTPVRALPAPATAANFNAPAGSDAAARLARVARIIDTLALQTTLLAVNAAVEAQRGGRLPPHA